VVDLINNRITANEARAFIDGNWKSKLEEIYDGVRTGIKTGANAYSFDVTDVGDFSKELVLRELEKDGYRIAQTTWKENFYTIFW
jgi:hypothetical protein